MQKTYGGLVSSPVNKMDTYRGSAVTRTTSGAVVDGDVPIGEEYEMPLPKNMIKYTAAEKLAEISEVGLNTSGLAYKYIDANIVKHSFENGVGIIEFDKNVTELINGNYLGWGNPSAFRNCAITSITLPNSITSIGDYTFYGCSSLTSITIPKSVTSIGNSAFENCSGLTSVTIPNGVTSMGYGVFQNCSSLTSITIPDGVTSIGNGVFQNCRGLTSISISNSVTSIGSQVFQNCKGLTSITIPDSVTSIGGLVFQNCNILISLTIPKNVTSVGGAVCSGCTNLEAVTVLPTTPPSINNSYYGALFASTSANLVIYVPAESVDAYKAASGWSTYADKIQAIPEE